MTSKSRSILNNFAKEREEFERKKKELEAEMNHGKQNLKHISKGIRNNEIIHLKEIESSNNEDTILSMKSHDAKDNSQQKRRQSTTFKNLSSSHLAVSSRSTMASVPISTNELSKCPSFTLEKYIPPNRRVSDWFFSQQQVSM